MNLREFFDLSDSGRFRRHLHIQSWYAYTRSTYLFFHRFCLTAGIRFPQCFGYRSVRLLFVSHISFYYIDFESQCRCRSQWIACFVYSLCLAIVLSYYFYGIWCVFLWFSLPKCGVEVHNIKQPIAWLDRCRTVSQVKTNRETKIRLHCFL